MMIARSAALAACLLLAGIGHACADEASGEVAYVDTEHKTMGLVGGPDFTLTDRALAKIEGFDWQGRHVIVVYQEKNGQKIGSDVILTGTNIRQEKRRNRNG
jgi:hypothetical protein